MEGVKKHYRTGDSVVRALDGIDLRILQGEYVAIMGPSGSGKSTMMNLLGCLDRPTAGSFRLDGVDVGGMDDDQLSAVRGRRIGFVFQSFRSAYERYNNNTIVSLSRCPIIQGETK